jgi:hypothetical protein
MESPAKPVDDEEIGIARHNGGEVIAYPLFKAKASSHAQAGGKIDPGLPNLLSIQW